MTHADAAAFLETAARYFESRPTKGEDRAHWANVYNAENCRKVVALLAQAMSAGTAKTPKAVEGQRPASAVAESHAPNPKVQP